MLRDHPYVLSFGSTGIAFVVATFGSDVVTRSIIGSEPLSEVIVAQGAYFTGLELPGTVQALVPFAMVAWMSVTLTKQSNPRRGIALLMTGLVALVAIYFFGYYEAQQYTQQHRWTEAALSIGLLPFESIPLLLLFLVARKPGGQADDSNRLP